MATDDEPTVYVVRPSSLSADQIEAEHRRHEDRLGSKSADKWEDGLMDAIASLGTYPKRCLAAPENDIFQQIIAGQTLRQLLYKQTRGGVVWRILFTVHEADENDPPTVQIHHIRHGAQAPLTEWPQENEDPD